MTDVDLTEFTRLSRPRKAVCQVGTAREHLADAERDQLDAALATDKQIINAGAIRQWLLKREQRASVSAITYHRNGACSCHAD